MRVVTQRQRRFPAGAVQICSDNRHEVRIHVGLDGEVVGWFHLFDFTAENGLRWHTIALVVPLEKEEATFGVQAQEADVRGGLQHPVRALPDTPRHHFDEHRIGVVRVHKEFGSCSHFPACIAVQQAIGTLLERFGRAYNAA